MLFHFSLKNKIILTELFPLFIFGVLAFSTLMISILLLRPLLSLLVEHKVHISYVGVLFLLGVPQAITYSLPMGLLLAALLTANRLSSRGEFTALLATGLGFFQILSSFAFFGVFVSLAGLVLNETLVPWAAVEFERVKADALRKPAVEAENIILPEKVGNVVQRVIYATKLQGGVLYAITWIEFDKQGKPGQLATAERAQPSSPGKWELFNGRLTQFFPDGRSLNTDFSRLNVDFSRTLEEAMKETLAPEQMTHRELRRYIQHLKLAGIEPEVVKKWETQLHLKVAIPFASFVFALLGVPLGVTRERSGSGIGLGVSAVIALIYYILVTVTIRVGQGGALSPVIAAWLPNGILLVVTLLLSLRWENPYLVRL